ncbi:MAG TPA: DUF368 domain-containing protein [Pseudomonadales bacterium]
MTAAPAPPGERPARGARAWLGVYLRGAVMGVAELVPGVSGGTIAFVTGIYDELVGTLAGLRVGALLELRRPVSGVVKVWRAHNLSFLLVLGLGMLTSVVLLAQLLTLAMTAVRPVVWGFFLGLIALSVWMLGRQLPARSLLAAGPAGLLVGVLLTLMEPFSGYQVLPVFFVAGAIAVSAWLLPAISGSFVLLTLGLYEPVVRAVASPGWDVLGVFLAGCAIGLLAFSRALAYALDRWRSGLLAFLTGFMIGASLKLWPWQADGMLLGPAGYVGATGEPAYLILTLASAAAGAAVIWLLSRLET